MAKSKRRNGRLGCGYIVVSGLILVGLLYVNVAFVRLFFGANLANIDERVFQAVQFVLPIIMITIEYWIYDQIFNRKKMPQRNDG